MGKSGIDYVTHSWECWQGCPVAQAENTAFMAPLSEKKVPPGSRVSVCPQSDFFHKNVDPEWRIDALEVIGERTDVTFVIPTKRPEMIDEVLFGESHHFYLGGGDYIPNVVFLLSVSVQADLDRWSETFFDSAPYMRKGLSVEPMLGPVNINSSLDAGQCDWVVCGCESGAGARSMNPAWARAVLGQCRKAGVPFFMKQMFVNNRLTRTVFDFPPDLWVRELES